MMNVVEHGHPLKLVDLQVTKEEDSEEESNDEEEMIAPDDVFVCSCNRCDLEINVYYKYYYKCIYDICDFSLHKFCAELPTETKFPQYPFPLFIYKEIRDWTCIVCRRRYRPGGVCYLTFLGHRPIYIDLTCAVEVEKKKIQHPSHQHPLVSLNSKPILCECSACGKEHKGTFFHCTTCYNFAIHNDCASLPKTLLIQHTTNNIFHHTHPLVLSYSFLLEEQEARYTPKCRVCDGDFEFELLWIYKCERCIYYVHVDCATSRRALFMSMLSTTGGKGLTIKNYKDSDYPNLLCLPFPDQNYSIPKQYLIFKEIGLTTYRNDKVSLQQMDFQQALVLTNHQHKLVLVDTKCVDKFETTSSTFNNSLIKCHDPMKKIELICNGCLRPILEMPFYKCASYGDQCCNFTLHEWCTRLPSKVENHPGHPKHPLFLMPNAPRNLFNAFSCDVCRLLCNGYAYVCDRCDFYVDVTCGLMPENITHKCHPNHILRAKHGSKPSKCLMCINKIFWELVFGCDICDVYIHPTCALLLPETITHVYDKHPMRLSYQPIENHKSKYFCEICEEKLNPHSCFYHCDECVQSVHSACAPLILRCETETHSDDKWTSIYKFINVKFGSFHKYPGHPHCLSFAQGIKSDGDCNICRKRLQYKMILKCVKCEFAIHCECSEH
ncbi:hypothetical protein R6Q59_017752 [Mikania micrantha]